MAKTDPSSVALNPAWRNSLVHALAGVGWSDGASAAEIEQQRETLKGYISALHKLAPTSGAYLNEVSLHQRTSVVEV